MAFLMGIIILFWRGIMCANLPKRFPQSRGYTLRSPTHTPTQYQLPTLGAQAIAPTFYDMNALQCRIMK